MRVCVCMGERVVMLYSSWAVAFQVMKIYISGKVWWDFFPLWPLCKEAPDAKKNERLYMVRRVSRNCIKDMLQPERGL